jgi:hypothetical protein
MTGRKPIHALLGTLVVLLPAAVLAAPTPSVAAGAAVSGRSLLASRQLWSTIDVCNPFDQPDMIGVRGSMPGDGRPHDTMYMRFGLEYLNTSTRRWTGLVTGAEPLYVAVGTARAARQAGRSFQLIPVPGKPAFTLRGVVSFQWRRGKTVVQSTSRPTTAGRVSLAGADPAGFSAATCLIG